MADFVTTEASGSFSHEAELMIADALRSAFSNRDSLIYQQYPTHLSEAKQRSFVALTHSRGWTHLSGVGSYRMFDEMRDVLRSNGTYTITFQRPPKRDMNEPESNA